MGGAAVRAAGHRIADGTKRFGTHRARDLAVTAASPSTGRQFLRLRGSKHQQCRRHTTTTAVQKGVEIMTTVYSDSGRVFPRPRWWVAITLADRPIEERRPDVMFVMEGLLRSACREHGFDASRSGGAIAEGKTKSHTRTRSACYR